MSVIRGLYTAMVGQSVVPRRRQNEEGASARPRAEEAAPRRAWSCGAKHGALIQVALAQKQVDGAGALRKAMFTKNQDTARVCFSTFSRGKHSAHSRSVPLA